MDISGNAVRNSGRAPPGAAAAVEKKQASFQSPGRPQGGRTAAVKSGMSGGEGNCLMVPLRTLPEARFRRGSDHLPGLVFQNRFSQFGNDGLQIAHDAQVCQLHHGTGLVLVDGDDEL